MRGIWLRFKYADWLDWLAIGLTIFALASPFLHAKPAPQRIPQPVLAAQVATHSVTLTWTASTSTVSGYNVYRSTVTGTGYAKLNAALIAGLSYVDSTVSAGATYYYVATAVDGTGTESGYSNQATAVIPNAPPPPLLLHRRLLRALR